MVWLITGANGQLGLTLAAQLTIRELNFVALDSKQLDITNRDQVNKVISNIRPQVIINTAAWTNVDKAESNRSAVFDVNAQGVENLVFAAKKTNSILVQISTDYVFSGESAIPWMEDSRLDPQNVYGQSKAAGEEVINKFYLERSYIVRTAWLYSEYGNNFAKTICRVALNSEKEVKVVNDQIGQPTSAKELADQIIMLVNSGAEFGTYHATSRGQTSWYGFATEIFKLNGAALDRVIPVVASEYPSIAKRPTYSVLGHRKWFDSGLIPIRPWEICLIESLPSVISSIAIKG